MSYLLGDIYIKADGGNFPITQDFGANEQLYNARYGLKGHNGIDIGCPSMTPVLAANDGFISELGTDALGTFDAAGYGRYIKIVHESGYLTIYGHLNDITVDLKQHVVKGQLIGHSNNSGFSSGPHLHFGVAPCDANGVKSEKGNGYSGYIDPMGERCSWEIKNLTEPVRQGGAELPPVAVDNTKFVELINKAGFYDINVPFLNKHGMSGWLTNNNQPAVDSSHPDPKDGERVQMYLAAMYEELLKAREKSPEAPQPDLAAQVAAMPADEKANALLRLLQGAWHWIYIPKQ